MKKTCTRYWLSVFYFIALGQCAQVRAQMWNGQDTLFGNEWLDYTKPYFKIRVAENGIYRIDFQTLAAAGFPVSTVPGSQLRLWLRGEQQRLFVSTDGLLSAPDFIEFYGQKNRGEQDRFLFDNPDNEQINPLYSMFTDTAAYFLTWAETGQALRFASVANDLASVPPKEPFCFFEIEKLATGSYIKREISLDVRYSWFNGDGYARAASSVAAQVLGPKKVFANGPAASLDLRFAGEMGQHRQQIRVINNTQDSLFKTDIFKGWAVRQHRLWLPVAMLAGNPKVQIQGENPDDDRCIFAAAVLRYPRQWDAESASDFAFSLDSAAGERYFELAKFDLGGGATPVLYDLTNGLRMEASIAGNLVKAKLPIAAGERKLLIINSINGAKNVSELRPANLRDFRTAYADFVIVSSKSLRHDPENAGADHVEAYAEYRRSARGGGHRVEIVDTEEIADQFGYGTRQHPGGLRNFCHWAKKNWPAARHIFIIGKGLNLKLLRKPDDAAALADSLHFVPTIGFPACDQVFVTGNRPGLPILSIGRLAATRPVEILDYLNKVKTYDDARSAPQTLAGRAWQKRVIHIGGGQGSETSIIRDGLAAMRNTLETNRFGADVRTFFKTSSEPVQESAYEQIKKLLDDGVVAMSIFGHSSAQVVDFDIGQASAYDNRGRYPLMMVMGCLSGSCSDDLPGLGEDFVLARERGAIAYFASTSYADPYSLRDFGQQFYQNLGGPAGYGASIGEQIRATMGDFSSPTSFGVTALLSQVQLQGDPAVMVYAAPGPDYIIDNQSVKFNPNPIGIENGPFDIELDIVNLGENTGGPLVLRLQQKLPNDTLLAPIFDTSDAPAFRKKLKWTLPAAGRDALGLNRFFAQLDPANALAESPAPEAESNNGLADDAGLAGTEVFFYADDVAPLAPPDFGIVGKTEVILRASTLNPDAPPQRYFFEIDTTARFDSPEKHGTQLFQRGGLLAWKVPFALRPNTVYYWRVARDSLVNQALVWRTASFVCLPGSGPGWNQSHFWQYRADDFQSLALDSTSRRWVFPPNAAHLRISVAFRGVGQYLGMDNAFYEGAVGDIYFNGRKVRRGVVVAVVDPLTGRFLPNPPTSPTNPDTAHTVFFHHFDTKTAENRERLMQFLENEIPDGHVVGLLTMVNPTNDTLHFYPELWAADSLAFGRNLFQVLENQGAKQVRQLASASAPLPYGLIFKKNAPDFQALDTLVFAQDSLLEIRRNFFARWSGGQVETPRIGPATRWQSIHWQHAGYDAPDEKMRLDLLASRPGQPDSLLFSFESVFDSSLLGIPAGQFPYLKIRVSSLDTTRRSVPQIGYFRLLFTPMPEGALDPAGLFVFQSDTLAQGQRGRMAVFFQNVSDAPFDSLLVKFRLEHENGTGQDFFKKYAPLAAGDTALLSLDFETRQLNAGQNRLLVSANPNRAQPELHLYNNVSLRPFVVTADRRNPLLDVTFDGLHLLDGDLVSPRPEIVASLRDDNPYLALSDTAAFDLSVLHPDGFLEKIAWNDPRVLFLPASAADLPKKNQARLEFRPVFTRDGDYQLRVNGRDPSGNLAGNLDYIVRFRVITKSSLSNVLPYPNPFSSSTCFVYTMTGGETPRHFRLQIMTVNGRVVREVTEAEFGPLRTGTHRSTFCWDGRDSFGDQLANGVYFYRITAKKADGSDFDFFENAPVDGFFKNGLGKLVLMR